jgi:hypothetical protein
MEEGVRYSLAGPLRWQEMDGEWVAFGVDSGALQHLDPLSAAVLATLEESPGSAEEVARRIALVTEVELSREVASGIDAILDDLHRTGFLVCRPISP